MNNRSFCSPAISRRGLPVVFAGLLALALPAFAGDAPAWMHALVGVPLPAHDEKTDAALLYSEEIVNVQSADKIKTTVRRAYKILRPDGRGYGTLVVPFGVRQKITSMHGWTIPADGKDYEVKDKEALETSLRSIAGSELVSDMKDKVLQIPAADPGNIVGYEYEMEEQPYALQDVWRFQGESPVRETRYTLQLPPGWEYKASWLNAPEVRPAQSGNQYQWVLSDVKEIRREDEMPPFPAVVGQMILSFFPSGGAGPEKSFANWPQMGTWYLDLTSGRNQASPEIQQKAAALTAGAATPLAKIRALAAFVQSDIRYVAIELGIGGWQPHTAGDVFIHRYGDCKDKAVLLNSMLREIGVDSYYVAINAERGSVTPEVPPHLGAFNHVILAIKIPAGVDDTYLFATIQHPKLGKILFFDPTNELTPLGEISGFLQANYGLLVTPDGGELVQLPMQPTAMNSIRRTGKLTLDSDGTLKGDFEETRLGDRAAEQRAALRSATRDSDRVKPIEALLANSLSTFQVTQASLANLKETDRPFGYKYSVVAEAYAKYAGSLLLVRPRVLGSKSSALLETKEPRKFAVEFDGPTRDTDSFEFTLPPGYVVDELPPAVDADYGFASYHSKSEVTGNLLRYTRVFEVKQLTVPLSKIDDLKKLYRIINGDERNTAVLKPAR